VTGAAIALHVASEVVGIALDGPLASCTRLAR
jgi:hypothetical protein